MTFADMMAMKRVSDPQISASGKWVLFSVTDVDLGKNTKVNHLWVVALSAGGGTNYGDSSATPQNDRARNGGGGGTNYGDSSATPQNDRARNGGGGGTNYGDSSATPQNDKQKEKQVTFGDGETFGRFSPDGKWVSMTVGDDIWMAPWDEAKGTVGKATQLTRVSGGGADGGVWSPDSKRLMFVASVWPGCSVKGSALRVGGGTNYGDSSPTAQNDSSKGSGGPFVVVGGTRDVAAWKTAEAATWEEEDACDKAKNAAADASPVKGQEWDGLLYRHWDHYTGAKRSHVLVVNADGSGVRDLTPATAVGDAETPTFSLGGPQGYAWAPDSKEIAYVTNLDPVPAASTNNDVFTLRLDEPGAKAVKVSTSARGAMMSRSIRRMGSGWRSGRRRGRGFEADKFRLMVYGPQRDEGRARSDAKREDWVDELSVGQPAVSISELDFASGYDNGVA